MADRSRHARKEAERAGGRKEGVELIPAPFEVATQKLDGGVTVLTIRGELDMNTAPELEHSLDALSAQEDPAILIDLSDCEFIDSTGVALIIRAWQRVDRNGGEGKGRLVLCCPNSQVRRLLDITGVERSISMHNSVDDARAELQAARS
jgi:anti-anti-sigma factor